MKLLVTGVKGQLGYDVCKVLSARGIEHRGVDIEDFDITNAQATHDYIAAYRPDGVIHCSAWTAVDRAEDELEKVRAVNAEGSRNIASVCKEIGAKLVYISTDYVFPGTGERFYEPDDPTGPLGAYGVTKLEGEQAVQALLERYFIVRVSWVFGKNGSNFIKTMLRLAETKSELNVVCDQIGSPTYTADLAPLLCDMVVSEKYGVYHATNEGIASWYDFACAIFREAGIEMNVVPVTTEEYGAKAKRPANSRMDKEKLTEKGFDRLPTWQDALTRYIRALEESGFFEEAGIARRG